MEEKKKKIIEKEEFVLDVNERSVKTLKLVFEIWNKQIGSNKSETELGCSLLSSNSATLSNYYHVRVRVFKFFKRVQEELHQNIPIF